MPGIRTRVQDCLQLRPEFMTRVEIESHGLRDVERTWTTV